MGAAQGRRAEMSSQSKIPRRTIKRLERNDPTLTTLNLAYNEIGDEDAAKLADALRTNTSVTKLWLHNNKIGAEGAAALADALRTNTSVTTLDLGINQIGAEGAAALAEALRTNTSVTELWLYTNQIGDEGAAKLAEALRTNTCVTTLGLGGNLIGAEGAAKLADALRTNTSVTTLNLASNRIGDEGAAKLAEALRTNTSVTTLTLGGNKIGDEGGAKLAEALRTNTSVTELGLAGNRIGAKGAAALAEALRTNSSVTKLWLYDNQIGDELQSMIDRMVDINKVASNPQEASNQKATEFGTFFSKQRAKEEAERSRLAAEAEAQRRQEEEQRLRRAEEERQRLKREEEDRQRRLIDEAERKEQDRREYARRDAEHKQEAEMVLDSMDDIRIQIRSVIAKERQDPVEVTAEYLKRIRTDRLLGKGFYGKVYEGFDKVLRVKFAIKVADSEALEGATAGRVDGVQMSFQNEMNVLSKLNHPNIARLYGYCIPSKGMEDMCLIYELATNGSLDSFWKDDLGRERLSAGKARIKIAFEVAMALRYMHEGLDWEDVCYHRDIKSANVCLAADFSARVIDCGLSKYVVEYEESFSSAGATGTKGYICPEYNDGDIKFQSACDMFSFGILLCELITGRTSCHGAHHYTVYEKRKSRRLKDDADNIVDWGDNIILDRLVNLASLCIKPEASDRPLISDVVHELQSLLAASDSNTDCKSTNLGAGAGGANKCRICGEDCTEYIKCSGSTEHIHCASCIERQLVESNAFMRQQRFSCLKDGCDSRDFLDHEVMGLISHNAWTAYQTQKNSAALFEKLFALIVRSFGDTNDRVDTSLRLQAQLCAGNGLPCPRRFLLIEADCPRSMWQHPREWAKNRGSTKLYLYFVCSHSLKVVSDKNRVKLRYSHEWVKKIAPAYNMSLIMLKAAASSAQIGDLPLELARLEEMDEWVKGLLDPRDKKVMERANANDWKLDEDVQTLVGQSLSLVAEKAASENINWQNELMPAFDFQQGEATFVKHEYLMLDRYNKWQGNPNS